MKKYTRLFALANLGVVGVRVRQTMHSEHYLPSLKTSA
jgi:hypothetical protein